MIQLFHSNLIVVCPLLFAARKTILILLPNMV